MRPAAATVVLGLALAVGAPTAWVVTRPEAAAGPSLERVLSAPTVPPETPAAPPEAPAGAGSLPSATARDASPVVVPSPPPPVRIELPGQGITAPVDPVGVAGDGQMELPEDVSRVGWYRFGPLPGQPGNTVLAGHVDDREQGAGALFPLRDVSPGAEIVVTDAAGHASRWRVLSRELIQKQVLPLESLFAREGPPRLVVLTCGGPFLPEYRSYRDNVVVIAEPVVDATP